MDRELVQQIQQATITRLSPSERAYAFGFLANWFNKNYEGFPRPCVLHPHVKPLILKVCNRAGFTYEDYIAKRDGGKLDVTVPADSPLRSLEILSEPASATAAALFMMLKVMNEQAPEGVKGLITIEERKAEVRFYYRESRKYFKDALMKLDLDEIESEYMLKAWERDMQKAIAHDFNLILPPQ